MDLNLYKIFYETANHGAISKAAESLYISQPAVSKSIGRLEEQLGHPLFIRSKKGVRLTAEGEILYDHLHQAFRSIETAEHTLKRMDEFGMGQLRIGVSTSLCKHILLSYLQDFIVDHPHVKISIACNPTFETISLLRQSKLDLGLICETPLDKSLQFSPLHTIHDTFVATQTYLDNLFLREGELSSFSRQHNLLPISEEPVTQGRHVSREDSSNSQAHPKQREIPSDSQPQPKQSELPSDSQSQPKQSELPSNSQHDPVQGVDFSHTGQISSIQNFAGLLLFSEPAGSRPYEDFEPDTDFTEKEILEKSNLMLLDRDNISRIFINEYFTKNQIHPRQILEINNMDLLIDFAAIGMGVACVVREFVSSYLDSGQVIEIPLEYPIPERVVGFVYPKQNPSPAAKQFLMSCIVTDHPKATVI